MLLIQQLAELGALDGWLDTHSQLRRILLSFAPALSLGALLALGLEEPGSFRKCWALLGARPRLSASLVVLGTSAVLATGAGPPIALDLAFTALVGSVVLAPGSWLGRALSAGPLRALGCVSYGVYLFHVPLLGLCRRLLPGLGEQPVLLFPAALALSWALAAVSHRYFEAPLSALARRRHPRRPFGVFDPRPAKVGHHRV